MDYFSCAQVILKALRDLPPRPKDPARLFKLATIWDARFEKEYYRFRSEKKDAKSESDYEKLKEEIGSKINPADILQDKIADKLKSEVSEWVARRFQQLAPVVHFLRGRIINLASTAMGAFLTPSEIANDWDEKRLTNDQIQEEIAMKMAPFFKPDWKVKFENQVRPAIERMR
jgi:hypothetical protein